MMDYEAEVILSPNGGYSRSVLLVGSNLRELVKKCKQHVQDNGFRGVGSRGGIIVRYPVLIGTKMDVTDVEDWVYHYDADKDKFVFRRGYYDPNEFLRNLEDECKK